AIFRSSGGSSASACSSGGSSASACSSSGSSNCSSLCGSPFITSASVTASSCCSFSSLILLLFDALPDRRVGCLFLDALPDRRFDRLFLDALRDCRFGRPAFDARFGRLFIDRRRLVCTFASEDVAEHLALNQINPPFLDQFE